MTETIGAQLVMEPIIPVRNLRGQGRVTVVPGSQLGQASPRRCSLQAGILPLQLKVREVLGPHRHPLVLLLGDITEGEPIFHVQVLTELTSFFPLFTECGC